VQPPSIEDMTLTYTIESGIAYIVLDIEKRGVCTIREDKHETMLGYQCLVHGLFKNMFTVKYNISDSYLTMIANDGDNDMKLATTSKQIALQVLEQMNEWLTPSITQTFEKMTPLAYRLLTSK
jgi:hypothetical protein